MRHFLQQPKNFIFLLVTSFFFFLLRLPSLSEPNWYGDEGIYQTIGYALRHGRLLYTGIWDNKPPLLYVVYAICNGDQFAVRFLSLLFGVAAIMTFYFVSTRIFKKASSRFVSTTLFALLYGLPILEGNIANAENFMLFPILLAAYLVLGSNDAKQMVRRPYFLAGMLLGVASLFKIVAVFDTLAFSLYLLSFHIPETHKRSDLKNLFSLNFLKKKITIVSPIAAGYAIPILVTLLYFLFRGRLTEFIRAVFTNNIDYVGFANDFIIPQGLLISKVILLAVFLILVLWKKELFGKTSRFIILWFGLTLFSAYFSQRPYTHYVLMLLPAFSLAIGHLLNLPLRAKAAITLLLSIIVVTVFYSFKNFTPSKTLPYYGNYIRFLQNKENAQSYEAFFDQMTPVILDAASYLRLHVKENDTILIWGNSPQMYRLTKTLPPGRFTVAYHMINSKANLDETIRAINTAKPRYIVILPDVGYIPFYLTSYTQRVMIDGKVDIYERTF